MANNNDSCATLRKDLFTILQNLDNKVQNLREKLEVTQATLERFREEAIEIAAGFAEYIEGKS